MIILEGPYVSDFLKKTIEEEQFAVLENTFAISQKLNENIPLISDINAIHAVVNNHELLYTNSENAINWISTNLSKTTYSEKVAVFKDKVKFRELIADLYPDFYFKKVAFTDLKALNYEELPNSLVLKPSVGFFSVGVHLIRNSHEWKNAIDGLQSEMKAVEHTYPKEVMDGTDFIIESYIEGDEFAIDCYFNASGAPVILNILEHQFSSDEDVSDRLYFTSTEIIKKQIDKVYHFLEKIGKLADLKKFPIHIEVRIKDDKIIPIEGNPLRFGGWCTTPDLAYHAYGFNPYSYYFNQEEPDWNQIIKDNDDSYYSITILNNTTGYKIDEIKSFNYENLLNFFEKPLELRKINHKEFSFFGFVFAKTSKKNFKELKQILASDLKEYVNLI